MKNWRESNEFRLMQPLLRPTDEIEMPEIATGAFKLKRDSKIYKVRRLCGEHDKQALEIHKHLLTLGWDLPKVYGIETHETTTYSFVEWIEGETGLQLRYRLGRIPEEHYYKLGQYASKLHNIVWQGKNVSVLNWWPRNILIKSDGSVMYLDLNKLYLTNFPECFTIKTIVAETPSVDRSQANAFLKGYRENREYDFKKIIIKYWSMFRIYHDIYLDGELVIRGARPFKKRLEMMNLPKNMTGMYILDLGYANGMFSLECANRGAKRVFAYDSNYVNIGSAHHRISDIGKLMAVYHGYTEDNLLYKHCGIDTDWFIEHHIPDSLRYMPKKKYDIIFALAIADHLSQERKPKFFKMLSDSTDCLYYESRMGGRRELDEVRLKKLTTFTNFEYLGNASCNQNKFRYSMFKCTRGNI